MTKQHGVVLVFRPDLSKEEIEKRLKAIEDIVDPNYTSMGHPKIRVEAFNPEWGGPVWYVP